MSGYFTYYPANNSVSIGGPGVLVATFVPLPTTTPWLNLVAHPSTCANFTLDGVNYTGTTSLPVGFGAHSLSANGCPSSVLEGISISGYATYYPGNTTLFVRGNATVVATYTPT